MITLAHFFNFHLAEVLRFLYRVLEICKDHDPEALLIQEQITNLETANNKFDAVYKLSRGSVLSNLLADYDRLRDKCIGGIKMCVESYTYHFDPVITDAAWRILNSIELHGKNIPHQNYQNETTTLFEIFGSWTNNTTLKNDLTTLHLTAWAAEMDRLNKLFSSTENLRVKETANLPATTASEESKVAIEVYRKLTSAIEARNTISTDGAYLPVINELNVLVHEYNTLVDRRANDDKGTPPTGS